MLTKVQSSALHFIATYTSEHKGCSPSHDDIRRHLGLASKSGVTRVLKGLEQRGFVRRNPYQARSLEVVRLPIEPHPSSYEQALAALVASIAAAPEPCRQALTDRAIKTLTPNGEHA